MKNRSGLVKLGNPKTGWQGRLRASEGSSGRVASRQPRMIISLARGINHEWYTLSRYCLQEVKIESLECNALALERNGRLYMYVVGTRKWLGQEIICNCGWTRDVIFGT